MNTKQQLLIGNYNLVQMKEGIENQNCADEIKIRIYS